MNTISISVMLAIVLQVIDAHVGVIRALQGNATAGVPGIAFDAFESNATAGVSDSTENTLQGNVTAGVPGSAISAVQGNVTPGVPGSAVSANSVQFGPVNNFGNGLSLYPRRATLPPTNRPVPTKPGGGYRPPSRSPTKIPTRQPTERPTRSPTKRPTRPLTKSPTYPPTKSPTYPPTATPTTSPITTRPSARTDGGADNSGCGTSPDDIPVNSMGVRFNKVLFSGPIPSDASSILPLGPADYPICPVTAQLLRQSLCWSVIMERDCSECDIPFQELIQVIGGLPTHPNRNDPFGSYWDELWEVMQARVARLRGDTVLSVLKRVPSVWSDFSLEDVAESVHNEYPGLNQANLIASFIGQGVPVNRTIVPSVSTIDFLRSQVMLAEINTWAISMVGPHNFGLKWTGGRARPEEIVWFLKQALETRPQEVATWDVPQKILDEIQAMELSNPTNFTAYSEGSPTHPSWPAMHSAGSVASFWLAVIMELTQEQMCEAMALDWGVSYGRTIAGVHFPKDNTAGLNLGQEILARKLPGHLALRFGSDRQIVEERIQSLRFNWENYLDGPCFP